MISGYQASPLGGLDRELQRNRELCEEHHIKHVPGLNEELGATSAREPARHCAAGLDA